MLNVRTDLRGRGPSRVSHLLRSAYKLFLISLTNIFRARPVQPVLPPPAEGVPAAAARGDQDPVSREPGQTQAQASAAQNFLSAETEGERRQERRAT